MGELKSRFIQAPAGRHPLLSEKLTSSFIMIKHIFWCVHDSQISIYDSKLECSRSVSGIAGALDSALTGASLAPVQNSHSDQGKSCV
ncbi:protein TOPLESS-RELATED PROTEIN 2-like [Pistacia vera]|uniref:protein TOPLESS-RELATED PROTEIN 2-like n=1 Tax=Pistacia vera TaxID=55513 RepID=UPI0012630484|nr:protein TOPLESS-RELATED PROTEIN 2-like [Pistacia vera]